MNYSFICPKCKSSLVIENSNYVCHHCEKFYITDDGYVDFLGDVEFYAGEATQEDMHKLIKDIDLLGYDQGLSKLFEVYPNLYEYISDTRRADWVCHCLGQNNLRCLDIGSGLGNLSELLSYVYEEVYSLEAVKERIEFQKRKYKDSQISNIKIVRGNALELPFPDNYFDLVVCNGVLEWIGSMNKSIPPQQGQLEFLREVRRVLSPKGCLYVGIENRYGIWYLMGGRDHSGLPYTSVLPRRLANLLVRRYGYSGGIYGDKSKKTREGRGYYTYTYSIFGYRSLFRKAGFKTKSFWVFPSYNRPDFSGNLNDNIGLKGFIRHLGEKGSRIKSFLPFALLLDKSILGFFTRLLSPSFLFYCYKNEIVESNEDVMLKEIDTRNYTLLSLRHKLMYFLYDKKAKPTKVVHLRRYKYSIRPSMRFHESSGMHQKPENNDPSAETGDGMWIENWISGRILNPLRDQESYMAIKWLIDFQNKTRLDIMTQEEFSQEINFVREGLSRLKSYNTSQNQQWLNAYEDYVKSIVVYRTS